MHDDFVLLLERVSYYAGAQRLAGGRSVGAALRAAFVVSALGFVVSALSFAVSALGFVGSALGFVVSALGFVVSAGRLKCPS